MGTYVFVAGAWHGSWCWSAIRPRLEAAGHRVLTPDLLGMTANRPTQIDEPLRRWADQIADVVRAEQGPVILVGHSRAGIVISEVAERVPERIGLLVYLCAFLLEDGQTLNEVAQRAANADVLGKIAAFHDDGTCTTVEPYDQGFFYSQTPQPLIDHARKRLVPEPIASFMTPVHVTEERFGSVPRAYIECTEDQAIPISEQRAMQQAVGVTVVATLDSDHSPFFSQPENLVIALEQARESI